MMELHQKLYTYRIGLLAGRCLLAGPFMRGDERRLFMREALERALVCHGHGLELVVHSLKALPSLACEARANQSNRQNDDFVRTELTKPCSGFI